MDRSLPRSTRPRRSVQVLVLACALSLVSGPVLLAHADDLNNKKHKAQQGVKNAQANLEDSSAALYAAMTKLRLARTELGNAQRRLASTEGQLTTARVLDAQMQAKLAAATQALTAAEAELTAGTQRVTEQRAEIGRLAAASFLDGDPRLLGFSMALNTQNPNDLATQFAVIGNLMDKQTAAYQRYQASEALLKVTAHKVAAARAEVAAERQAAAVNLARKRVLEQAAATNRARVVALVAARKSLALRAAAVRASDALKLRQAQRQEARIKRLIMERARHHKGGYRGPYAGFLIRPVAHSYITSPYGWRRHPIFGYWGLHDGDDFAASCGTPELASASGTVFSEYYSDVWGNRLFIDVGKINGKEMTLIYNHISRYKVGTGARVNQGDVVAYAGTTGWSTGCHLHFTVLLDGTAVDPVQFF